MTKKVQKQRPISICCKELVDIYLKAMQQGIVIKDKYDKAGPFV